MLSAAAAVEAMAAEAPGSEGGRTPGSAGGGGGPNQLRRKSAPNVARTSCEWASFETRRPRATCWQCCSLAGSDSLLWCAAWLFRQDFGTQRVQHHWQLVRQSACV